MIDPYIQSENGVCHLYNLNMSALFSIFGVGEVADHLYLLRLLLKWNMACANAGHFSITVDCIWNDG